MSVDIYGRSVDKTQPYIIRQGEWDTSPVVLYRPGKREQSFDTLAEAEAALAADKAVAEANATPVAPEVPKPQGKK